MVPIPNCNYTSSSSNYYVTMTVLDMKKISRYFKYFSLPRHEVPSVSKQQP